MPWRALQSRHLLRADYDPPLPENDTSGVLTIQFVNGALHRYYGVPQTVADTLFQVGSPGTYFHDKIRGQYPEQKISSGVTRSGRTSRRRY